MPVTKPKKATGGKLSFADPNVPDDGTHLTVPAIIAPSTSKTSPKVVKQLRNVGGTLAAKALKSVSTSSLNADFGDKTPRNSSNNGEHSESFEAGFRLFAKRIAQYNIEQKQIKSHEDIDFVFVVNHPINNAKRRKVSFGPICYEYIPDDLDRIREQYLDALKKRYFISYDKVVGKSHDFYMIHLSYIHLGLLAEILRYSWQMKTSDKETKIAYKSFKFHKWIGVENKEFDVSSRSDFSDKLRYDLTYQFLIGASVKLESPQRQTRAGCGCCPSLEKDEPKFYDLMRVLHENIFDDWMVPHEPSKMKIKMPPWSRFFPGCMPCIEGCISSTGEGEPVNTSPVQGAKEPLRDFLTRYCTLKSAFTKHYYPRGDEEKVAGADLWHIIPVHKVTEYFGEKIGFYFAWAELLVMSMVIPAILGALFFIVVAIYYSVDVYLNKDNEEFSNSKFDIANFIQYVLVKTCDNYATPAFAILMILWGTTFRETWVRREAWYRFLWAVEDLDVDELQHIRGQRSSSPKDDNPPPVKSTGARIFFFTVSAIVLLLFICLVFLSVYVINVINLFSFGYCPTGSQSKSSSSSSSNQQSSSGTYGTSIGLSGIWIPAAKSQITSFINNNQSATTLPYYAITQTSTSSSIDGTLKQLICQLFGMAQVLANSVSIFVLDLVFTNIAYKLTDWEGHRTMTKYSNALILKLFVFRFFNFYSILFFTAFASNILSLKFLSNLIPGTSSLNADDLGDANSCGDQPCLLQVSKQLLGILITKPIFSTISGLVMPSLNALYQTLRTKAINKIGIKPPGQGIDGDNESDEESPSEPISNLAADLEKESKLLHLSPLGQQQFTSDESTERVIVFGALLMFSVALPPACALTILFMRVDLTLDVRRIMTRYKRPIPHRANGIGIWDSIVNFLTYLAIITNPLIVVLTSTWGSQFDTWWKFWIFILFEHFTIGVRALVAAAIPDIPGALEREKLRRKIVRQELLDEAYSKKNA